MAVPPQFLDGKRERQIVADGVFDDCISLANGNSNGMVANSALLSAEAASGGVTVLLEVLTRVHLPSAE